MDFDGITRFSATTCELGYAVPARAQRVLSPRLRAGSAQLLLMRSAMHIVQAAVVFILIVAPSMASMADVFTRMTSSAVDANGNVYIAGSTDTDILPAAPRTLQTVFSVSNCPEGGSVRPCRHGFLAKIGAGGEVVWATYLGGSGSDEIRGIATSPTGEVYAAGVTSSADFPVAAGAFQTRQGAGFVAEISADGHRLLAATYLDAEAGPIAVDASGAVFVTGAVRAPEFQTSAGAFQATRYAGSADAFVLKLDAALSVTGYSTLLGGSSDDFAYAIQVDSAGNAVVTGITSSLNSAEGAPFPVTPGAWVAERNYADVFVVKLNPSGTAALFSSVFGGSGVSAGLALALDSRGSTYVSGTGAADFPVSQTAYRKDNANGFLVKLGPAGELAWSTRVPVAPNGAFDGSFHLAATSSGQAFVSGVVIGPFQTTADSFQPCTSHLTADNHGIIGIDETGAYSVYGSWLDRAVALDGTAAFWVPTGNDRQALQRVTLTTPPPPRLACISNAASFLSGPVSPGEVVSLFGSAIGPAQPAFARLDADGRLAKELSGTQVLVNGQPIPLLYAGPSQINAVVPFGLAGAEASFVVRTGEADLPAMTAPITAASPGVFSAVLNQDNTLNSASNPAKPGTIVQIWGTGAGPMDPLPADGEIGTGAARIRNPLRLLGVIPPDCFMGGCVIQYLEFDAPLYYAGDAPEIVQGVFQINARISARTLLLGDRARRDGVPVTLQVGDVKSPPFTLWVSEQ